MKSLILSLFLMFSASSMAKSFLPENNLNIPVGDKAAGGITEKEFNDVISKVEAVYKPLVVSRGKELVFQRNWADGTVNAYASQRGNQWIVAMFGGLARSKEVTVEGFALVVCHEIGHHLGGAPFWANNTWAAAEGQADYYSTLKCFKRAFGKENVKLANVLPEVTEKCEKIWKNSEELALCEREISGGLSLASLLADLGGDNVPTLATPDTSVVTKTIINGYPGTQCRLDQYVAGALCNVDEDIDTSATDEKVGTCMKGLGARTSCWYAPKSRKNK